MDTRIALSNHEELIIDIEEGGCGLLVILPFFCTAAPSSGLIFKKRDIR